MDRGSRLISRQPRRKRSAAKYQRLYSPKNNSRHLKTFFSDNSKNYEMQSSKIFSVKIGVMLNIWIIRDSFATCKKLSGCKQKRKGRILSVHYASSRCPLAIQRHRSLRGSHPTKKLIHAPSFSARTHTHTLSHFFSCKV